MRSTDALPLVTINQIQPILRAVRGAGEQPAGDPAVPGASRSRCRPTPIGGGAASEGTLAFIDNAVDTTTGTILLKASFPNTDGALWPGAFVNVRLRLFVDQDALVVPASAVVSGPAGQLRVRGPARQHGGHEARQGRPHRRRSRHRERARSRPGDRVVTDGQLRLRQGVKVQIKPPGDSAQARAS